MAGCAQHQSDTLLSEIKALVARNPDRLTMDTVRASNKGYSAEMLVVTFNHVKKTVHDGSKIKILLDFADRFQALACHASGVTAQQRADPFVGGLPDHIRVDVELRGPQDLQTAIRFIVFQSFGQHGRELITSELALSLLYILTEKRKIAGVDLSSFEKILEHLVIKVVPIENFNGRKRVEAGEICDRRNGRGVDLNRNWSVDWGKKEKDYNPFEEDPGTAPFSEPEAQIMQELSKSFKPHIWVNVHSGMEALFMPYDHKNTTPDGAPSHLMRSVLENVNHRNFQDSCLVGSGGGAVGYLAHGTTTDYLYDIAKVPMPFTFEIYGDEKASTDDCFKMFNPVDKITFDVRKSRICTSSHVHSFFWPYV
ncbi:Carboxypeptidase O [Triticum urartu]|uniref:Carboxypeptidase O n=1 Tax=Triticum urartu TaxID=4572 RepID=M7ZA81_TRIUA|nr:Carboxypeptidase O [Triticum urartu]